MAATWEEDVPAVGKSAQEYGIRPHWRKGPHSTADCGRIHASSFFPASCSWDAEDNTESIQDEYELVFSGIVNERKQERMSYAKKPRPATGAGGRYLELA
ncbi:MAG: hypothetical protein ACLT98_14115 [Eggerthellaceae bacterium]